MALASDIITAAYREGNLIAIGTTPTTAQNTEALSQLNRLKTGILGFKMGENLKDWMVPQPQRTAPVAANFPQFPGMEELYGVGTSFSSAVYPYPPNNRRIIYGGTAQTVYFPEKPNPGAQMALIQSSGAGDGGQTGDVITLNANGRTIQTQKTQTYVFNSGPGNTPFAPQRWFYRDDLGDWVSVTDMALSDNMPYPEDFDLFFICALSKRLAPSYGKIVAQETITTALQTEAAFLARYRQPTDTVYGSDNFPRSYQSYIAGNWWW